MENRNFVDQRRERKLQQFLLQYGSQLACQGTIVPTWRRRAGRKVGPYFLLVCRDAEGRQRSVYLGPASDLVDETRNWLAQLQAPLVEQRHLARVLKHLRLGLMEARHQLDLELTPLGLSRKGSEIRGWSHATDDSFDRPRKEIGCAVPDAERKG